MARRASLLDQLVQDMLSRSLLSGKRVLTQVAALYRSGCYAYELESAEDYIRKVFSLDVNTSYHSTTFHRVARGFVGDAPLEAALAKELLSKIKFAPSVISHGNTIQFASSTFVVICHRPLGQTNI